MPYASERRELEDLQDKLTESKRRERLYAFAFEQAEDACVVLDDEGRVVLENAAARALFSGDDDLRRTVARIASARARSATRESGATRHELRSARGRDVFARVATHAPDRHFVFLRDVTDARRLARELEHARRIDSLGYVTASAVHDLNGLLAPLSFFVVALGKEVGSARRARQLAFDAELLAERMRAILRQVLAFARREPEGTDAVNVGRVLFDLRPLLEILVGRRIDVVLRVEPGVGALRVSSAALERAILNIATNARDAMPGGGLLTLHAYDVDDGGEAAASANDVHAGVAIAISDSGEGISEEARARMFDEGFTTKLGGSGLGLVAVRRFVDDCGGAVSVRSRPGQGTTITMVLPRAVAEARRIDAMSSVGATGSLDRASRRPMRA
jgi:signal transduction histidine kinase